MSVPQEWSGALPPRKKSELFALAEQLGVYTDTTVTKPELLDAIRLHLDANEPHLAENPRFRGLYVRKPPTRKASAIPVDDSSDASPPVGTTTTAFIVERKVPARTSRSTGAATRLSPVASAPSSPVRNHVIEEEVAETETAIAPVTPSRIALPASPARMLSNAVARFRPEVDGMVANVNRAAEQIGTEKDKALASTKKFMSSSNNLALISVFWELVVLLYMYIPLVPDTYTFTPPGNDSPWTLNYSYPPSAVFSTKDIYTLLAQWSLPTLVIPIILGNLISFQSHSNSEVDPITSGIVRLVCALSSNWGVPEELLSSKTRVLSASTALAFSVVEMLTAQERRVVPASASEEVREKRFPKGLLEDTPSGRSSRRLLLGAA